MTNKIVIKIFTLDDNEEDSMLVNDALTHADIPNLQSFIHQDRFFDELDEHVHIAIIDHSLSHGVTGLEVMHKLLRINPYCFVIIISGNTDPNLIIKYQAEGSSIFIRKDDGNFTGKLVYYINKAYYKIHSFLEFQERQLQLVKELKYG